MTGRYLVITGLRLRTMFFTPVFWLYAVRSMSRAKADPDCLFADNRTVDGHHHTVTLWTSRAAAARFNRSDAHARAISIFPSIATGRIWRGEASDVPDWDTALDLWQREANEV